MHRVAKVVDLFIEFRYIFLAGLVFFPNVRGGVPGT